MNKRLIRILLLGLIALVALAAVGGVAYQLGLHGGSARPIGGFGPMRGWGYAGPGAGGWFGGLLVVLLVVVGIVLLAGALDGGSRGTVATPPSADGVDRLRELTEMHDRGALTDEEFAAAKRKLLGL